jgi:hypothetical protein
MGTEITVNNMSYDTTGRKNTTVICQKSFEISYNNHKNSVKNADKSMYMKESMLIKGLVCIR